MTEEIISLSISTKVWDWAGIQLVTPGSVVGLATNWDMGPVRGRKNSSTNGVANWLTKLST